MKRKVILRMSNSKYAEETFLRQLIDVINVI